MTALKPCSIPDCDRFQYAKGWCRRHWDRARRTGDPLFPPKPKCSVEGCTNKHYGRGWCLLHWRHWRDHGDPLGGLFGKMDEVLLPNPWVNVAPPCPRCGDAAYLWATGSPLPWFCPPCRKRFDVAEEAAA